MNIQHLRHSLKVKWLLYYRQNRPWLVKLRIWGTYDGQRRPSSSFVLAALSNLEPQLPELFPFMIDLSNDPDQIVAALGLNFNPDQELKSMMEAPPVATTNANGNGFSRQALPKVVNEAHLSPLGTDKTINEKDLSSPEPEKVVEEDHLSLSTQASNLPSWVDESCRGKATPNGGLVLSILLVIGVAVIAFVGFA